MSVRFALTALALAAASAAQAVPLTPGDLFVYRVGSGAAGLTNAATQVFVDEYTTAGVLVQSIALPTATLGANGLLTASGTATSEGLLTASTDGQYLVLTGYNAAVGTASVASSTGTTTARTVGRIDLLGNVDTTTKLTDLSSGNNPRGVASTNGTDLWVGGGAGGVRYTTLGSSTSTQLSTTVTNVRGIEIFGNQLYASDSSGSTNRLSTVGTGLPTTAGQTMSNLPGFATSTGSPYGFYFADLSAAVAGVDTLYVADDSIGITKYSLVGGTWVSNGTVGAATDTFRGLAGVTTGGSVALYATGQGGSAAAGGGKLVSFLDGSGYNGAFSATATLLATAATNTAFRGVAYIAPVPEPGAFSMLFAGLAALGFVARRRHGA